MRLYTIRTAAGEELAAGRKGTEDIFLLKDAGVNFRDMNELIENLTEGDREKIENPPEGVALIPLKEAKLAAPVPRPRQDVICLGINYFAHAEEAAGFSEEAFGGERPYTIYFSKRVTEAAAPGELIPSYQGLVDSLDYETELGVILGKTIKSADLEEAEAAIFGYTIINDISARNLQTRHKQWYLGKSLDKFTPMGPCIVTADEIRTPVSLDIRCRINGELRQDSNTSLLIQKIPNAIAELSAGMTLAAGTIIATGTPAGVGMGMKPPVFLKPGDRIECYIESIGTLENQIGD